MTEELPYARRRKRPLSLWNPLDYLVLLYWVFFFPQALRWYVERFGTAPAGATTGEGTSCWTPICPASPGPASSICRVA